MLERDQNLQHVIVKQKNLLLVFLLFLLVCLICGGLFYYRTQQFKKANRVICQLMTDNYIDKLSDDVLEECLEFTTKGFYTKQSQFLKDINLWLSSFNISHLYLYNNAENKKMWEGIGQESGILAKHIFGHWTVTEVHNPQVDIQVGDYILKINKEKIRDAQHILVSEGDFLIQREGEKKVVPVKIRQIHYNENMVVKEVNKDWTYLKIPTFKSDYFDYKNLEEKLTPAQGKSVILDLRGNLGGNYVSILRVLSRFLCESKRVGKIYHQRTPATSEQELEDDLDDSAQILRVTQHNPIYLKTFPVKACKPVKRVIMLINEKSASVTELLVKLIQKNIKNVKSYGTTTAGHMLLAIWYPIEDLGQDIMMSVPYAWSTDLEQDVLEGTGVAPTESLQSEQLLKYQGSHDPLLDYILDEIKSNLKAKQL
ncbi:MAG: S41 family peptidase [Bdellovibrionaceae bacterium]|nr:S41 family peptidase [Pseudobdellovibrionaceae bacterium]